MSGKPTTAGERYHLLAVGPKEFVIVCAPLIRAEKLGTIIQSALDVATLEKQKEDLEQSPMVYLSYGEERLGASCRRRLVFSDVTSETVEQKLEAAEQAEASSAEAAPSTSVQEKEHRSAVLAHIIIDEKRSLVRVQVNSSLHKGVHNFTIEELDDHRFGAAIIENEYKVAIHNCDGLPDLASGREHATWFIVLRKRGTNVATLKIRHCAGVGIYEGEDCLVNESDSFYSALLRFKKPLDDCRAGVKKKLQKGKGHCCVYCKQFFVEITSHLKRMHSTEEEVQSALQLPVNSKRRNHAFSILRLKGDDSFNKTAPVYDRISMRKISISSKDNLLRCYNCQAWLSKRNFARHERKCTSRPSNHQQVADKARKLGALTKLQCKFKTGSTSSMMRERFLEVLTSRLRQDVIYHEIFQDSFIVQAAQQYALKYRENAATLKNARASLRRMARIIAEVKDRDLTVNCYEDLVMNSNYELCLEGIYAVCGLDVDTGKYSKPGVAGSIRSELNFLLDAAANGYKSNGLTDESPELKLLYHFKSVHNYNIANYVSRSATRSRLERRATRTAAVPNAADVKKFVTYISETAEEAYRTLVTEGFNRAAWLKLGKAEAAKIIVFNRRRVSEIATMSLDMYHKKAPLDDNSKKKLTVLERQISDNYLSMRLIGKRQHILNILLDKEQCKHLDVFIEQRSQAGVSDDNRFLFGVPNKTLYIDGSQVIREFAIRCGAENPDLLRSTCLRRQVATLSQLLVMDDNQIGQIAKMMGHSQKVHQDVYRLDNKLFEMTSWAKFLTLVSEDDIAKYRGKTFEEILSAAAEMPDVVNDADDDDHVTIAEVLLDEDSGDSLEVSSSSSSRMPNSPCGTPKKRRSNRALKPSIKIACGYYTPPRGKRLKRNESIQSTSPKQTTPNKKFPTPPPSFVKVRRKNFTAEQLSIMRRVFVNNIVDGKLPALGDCDDLVMKRRDVFADRCGRDLYNWVQYQRNKRRSLNSSLRA